MLQVPATAFEVLKVAFSVLVAETVAPFATLATSRATQPKQSQCLSKRTQHAHARPWSQPKMYMLRSLGWT